ncbi:hypothetical protein [Flavobacterium psychrophilum]|uniref:hypothetical protein n=1 Tax=Flavobacterium psychrophilum TaxID=96345 RepID=UPI00106CE933|nr:hypothetical protein [Flavobacterium psychrophilum]
MDNIKFYLINKRIDRERIMLFENDYLDRVFAVNNRNRITENSIYGYYKIYNKPVYTEKEKEEEPYMFLTYKEEKNSSQVSIRNSIRKWHFGKRSISELDKWQFLDCICSLSKLIFNDSHSLLNATNLKLEIGRTLKISSDLGLRVLVNCIGHKEFHKRIIYPGETQYFLGESQKNGVIAYNKGLEMQKQGLFKRNFIEQLSKKHMLLRLEVKISKVSDSAFARNNFKTLNDVFNNWDLLLEYWKKQMLMIDYIDKISAEDIKYIKTEKRNVVADYLANKGFADIGADSLIAILKALIEDTQRRSNVKSTVLKKAEQLLANPKKSTKSIMKQIINNKK